MRITNDEVCEALILHADTVTRSDAFLKDCTTADGYGYIASLLTRGGNFSHLSKSEILAKKEICLQSDMLVMSLLPIWLKLEQTLPRISGDDIKKVFEQGMSHQWSAKTVFDMIGRSNELWGQVVDACRDDFTDVCSETFVAAIIQAFLNKVEPLEATPTDAPLRGIDAEQVDPDIRASVDEQVANFLAGVVPKDIRASVDKQVDDILGQKDD